MFKELVAPAAVKLAALGECMHQHIFLSSSYSYPLLLSLSLVIGVPYEEGVGFGRALLAPVPSLLNGIVKSGGMFLHTSPCFA